MSHVVQDLVLVKSFALEAERQLEREDDFGNGLAVSLAQDAAELLLRIVVRERSIPIEIRAGLDKLIAAIDRAATKDEEKVPHLARIEDLNKARVNFKHSGHCPTRADAKKLVRYGFEFLEECYPRFFRFEYRAISLTHQVKNERIRELLLDAEKHMAVEDWRASVFAAAEAKTRVEASLAAFFPPTSRANVFGDNNPGVINYLNGLRLIALAGLVGYDPRELMRFRAMAPTVSLGHGDHPPQTIMSGPVQYAAEHAEFCYTFALGFALAVQKRLG